MLWTRLSPPMLEIVTSKADRAVMAVTLNRVSGGTGIRCDAQTLPDLGSTHQCDPDRSWRRWRLAAADPHDPAQRHPLCRGGSAALGRRGFNPACRCPFGRFLVNDRSADSDTIRPPQMAWRISSLLTTRSRLVMRYSSRSNTYGYTAMGAFPQRSSRRAGSRTKFSKK